MVDAQGDWPWSTDRAHTGQVNAPAWLEVGALHGFLLGRTAKTSQDQTQACVAFAQVLTEQDKESICASAGASARRCGRGCGVRP